MQIGLDKFERQGIIASDSDSLEWKQGGLGGGMVGSATDLQRSSRR
jgi:hypothetical protein